MLHCSRYLRLRFEGRPSGEQFEENHAERIEVAARVRFLALCLLGGDVGDGPENRSGRRQIVCARERGLCDAEVSYFDASVGREEHVCRFDVTVNDAASMCIRQGVAHGAPDGYRSVRRQRPLPLQDVRERAARAVLHNDEMTFRRTGPILRARVVSGHDVCMCQPGGGQSLAAEALDELRIVRELRMKNLHRDRARQHFVAGAPDLPHAAARKRDFEQVTIHQKGGFFGHPTDATGCWRGR
jgi:hypothetical protein